MPRFLNTKGNPTLGLGICGRCSRKFPLHQLVRDGNTPGLLVCEKDRDVLDPYRLPARQPDRVSLPFTRPDVSIATNPAGIITEDGDEFLIADDEYLKAL